MLRESSVIAEGAPPLAGEACDAERSSEKRVVQPPPLATSPVGAPPAVTASAVASAISGITIDPAIRQLELAASLVQLAVQSPHDVQDDQLSFADWLSRAPSWLISMVVHLLLMLLLALLNVDRGPHHGELGVLATQFNSGPRDDSAQLESPTVDVLNSRLDQAIKASDTLVKGNADKLLVPAGNLLGTPVDISAFGTGPNPIMPGGAGGMEALLAGNSLETRLDGAMRQQLLLEGGGTPESEAAVDRALLWLSRHQNSDGSWHFNLKKCVKCNGRCRGSEQAVDARIASTGMALLPFLGRGYTHKSGEYKTTVHAGLYFLIRSMHADQHASGSLVERGGRMYGHGLASIALCEAYGMTRDKMLKRPAQMAIHYIVLAQDPTGGGWRYGFQEPGDTSVVGWQLMALKSAQMAYLDVPKETIRKVEYFLDYVQSDGGAGYGYTSSGTGQATTAIGLLCRMYLGNRSKQEAIARGAQVLSAMGPSMANGRSRNNDLYYNYYATQVLHHIGGEQWNDWNTPMRSYLISTQVLDEHRHDYGSWHFQGNDMGLSQGGRLYCTAMSAMILEVYYRHMPLYRQKPGTGFFN